jgi:hypothetical protein
MRQLWCKELINPGNPDQCWSYFNFEVVEGTFNVTADLAVLLIAIPLLFKLRVPLQQKIILITVFGMGIFVIAAALLTKIYSLVPSLVSYSYLNWYFREASVSVYVTNLPAVWALLRDTFPGVRHWGYPRVTYHENTTSNQKRTLPSYGSNRSQTAADDKDDVELFHRLGSTNSREEYIVTSRAESQEEIIPSRLESQGDKNLKIYKDVTFSVKAEQG